MIQLLPAIILKASKIILTTSRTILGETVDIIKAGSEFAEKKVSQISEKKIGGAESEEAEEYISESKGSFSFEISDKGNEAGSGPIDFSKNENTINYFNNIFNNVQKISNINEKKLKFKDKNELNNFANKLSDYMIGKT